MKGLDPKAGKVVTRPERPTCEDCGVRVHYENPGLMISADGKHFICPECAPKYDHIFPAKSWDSQRGCWVTEADQTAEGESL